MSPAKQLSQYCVIHYRRNHSEAVLKRQTELKSRKMSAFTKDELRTLLTNHGIELPAFSAKKEELISLYEQFVEPLEHSKGEFSSDDEGSLVDQKSKKKSPRKSSSDKSQIIIEEVVSEIGGESEAGGDHPEDLDALTDEELAARLRQHGVDVGPIVGNHLSHTIMTSFKMPLALSCFLYDNLYISLLSTVK